MPNPLEGVKEGEWLTFMGADYARGGIGGEASLHGSTTRDPDDFALSAVRCQRRGPVQYIYAYRRTGIEAAQASAVIHRATSRLRPSIIMLDPGGGLDVRDNLRSPIQRTGQEEFGVVPICTMDDYAVTGICQRILSLFRRGDPYIASLGMVWANESRLPNKAHGVLRAAFDSQGEIQVPAPWPGWEKSGIGSDAMAMRAFLNDRVGLPEQTRVHAEIDLALAELLHIDRKKGPDGRPVLVGKDDFVFTSRSKKDAAYALMYAYFAAWIWRELGNLHGDNQEGDDAIIDARPVGNNFGEKTLDNRVIIL
jgi:hypothetical protein